MVGITTDGIVRRRLGRRSPETERRDQMARSQRSAVPAQPPQRQPTPAVARPSLAVLQTKPLLQPRGESQAIEAAIIALGDSDAVALKFLQDVLKKAKQDANCGPVGERLDVCTKFVERARKRLAKADEDLARMQHERAELDSEFAEGVARLEALRAEAAAVVSCRTAEYCCGGSSHARCHRQPSHGACTDEFAERVWATLPMRLGGLGLRSASRMAPAAFWASWADALPMLSARLPELTDRVVEGLSTQPRGCLAQIHEATMVLDRSGFVGRPGWHELRAGRRPSVQISSESWVFFPRVTFHEDPGVCPVVPRKPGSLEIPLRTGFQRRPLRSSCRAGVQGGTATLSSSVFGEVTTSFGHHRIEVRVR